MGTGDMTHDPDPGEEGQTEAKTHGDQDRALGGQVGENCHRAEEHEDEGPHELGEILVDYHENSSSWRAVGSTRVGCRRFRWLRLLATFVQLPGFVDTVQG